MNHFEEKYILSNAAFKSKIKFYGRYVDDTFLLFDGTSRQIDCMVAALNKVNPNIQFTTEHETEGSINYLDCAINRKDDSLSYNIYSKPTTTDMTIHSSSFHPTCQKMAAYNCFVYRALRFPLSTEDREKELNIIYILPLLMGIKVPSWMTFYENIQERGYFLIHPRRKRSIYQLTSIMSLPSPLPTCSKRTTSMLHFPPATT